MKVYSKIFWLYLILLVISACSPVPTATPAAPLPSTQAASTGDFYPLDTRTGIGAIDTVLDAIAFSDLQKQRALINFLTAPCTFADGLGGPPKCRQAETEGTEVEVLPFIGGEGTFLRRDESVEWGGIDALGLYAIYRVSEGTPVEEYYPAGDYAIIFAAPDNRPAPVVRVNDGGIVRVDFLFDTSLEALNAMIARESAEIILTPRE